VRKLHSDHWTGTRRWIDDIGEMVRREFQVAKGRRTEGWFDGSYIEEFPRTQREFRRSGVCIENDLRRSICEDCRTVFLRICGI
jgi:RNase P subunit RPR2